MNAIAHGGHDGYAYYLMFRVLWHYLHWWAIPVAAALITLTAWVSVLLGGGED